MNKYRLCLRITFCFVFSLSLLLLRGKAEALAVTGDKALHVSIHADHLTAKATDVPLLQVLQEIAKKADIKVYGEVGVINERITVDFEDLKIQEGLTKILSDYNVAYIYSPEKRDEHSSIPHKLSEVWVLSKGMESSSAHKGQERGLNFVDLTEREMKSPDPSTRLKAIEAMGEREDPSVIPVLLSFIQDSDQTVRISAIDALSNFGPQVPADQIETVFSHGDPQTRIAILTSGLEIPRKTIVEHALHDPSPQVRIEALHVLEGDPEMENVAKEVLKDPDPTVQEAAREVLQTVEEDLSNQTGQGQEEDIQIEEEE